MRSRVGSSIAAAVVTALLVAAPSSATSLSFTVALRVRIPGQTALDGCWKPPGVVCLDCRP